MESVVRDVRTARFWRIFGTQAFASFGLFAAVAGVLVLFWPDLFKDQGWVAVIVVLISVLYGGWRAWPRPIQTKYGSPETLIRLVRGDLFEQQDAHLIVGVSDTFDTASPYIAMESVQGKFLQRVYSSDVARLDADIERELAAVEPVGPILGKSGKTVRYPLGTTITLRESSRSHFLVAYTTMDAQSSASSTTDGVWHSLSELWNAVRVGSNGRKVCMPMIGGGLSKLSPVLPALDSVRFIALSFMLASRTRPVCSELAIVVPPQQYDALDHLEIQAFLNSLRPS